MNAYIAHSMQIISKYQGVSFYIVNMLKA